MQQAAAFHRAAARLAVGGPLRELLLVLRPERPLALLLADGVLLPARPPAADGALLLALLRVALLALLPAVVMVPPERLQAHLRAAATDLPVLLPAAVMVPPERLQAHLPVAATDLPVLLPAAVMVPPAHLLVAATVLPERLPVATVLPERPLVATVLPELRLDPAGARLPDPAALRQAPSAAASFLLPVGQVDPAYPRARPARGRRPTPLVSVGTRSRRTSSVSASASAWR